MYEWSIQRPIGYDAHDFYLYEYGAGRAVYYVTISKAEEDELPTFERHELKEKETAKPLFRISGPFMAAYRETGFAIQLVDWLCDTFRVQPSKVYERQGHTHGKLEATELHLKDMRELVRVRYLDNKPGPE